MKTCRHCRVDSGTEKLTPSAIASIRKKRLGVSQALFAGMLNVAPQTVHAWEQGIRKPSPMALRLLAFAKEFPGEFMNQLRPSLKGGEE